MHAYVDQVWRRAKRPIAIPLGPIQLLLSLRRAIRVSSNRRRRQLHGLAWLTQAKRAANAEPAFESQGTELTRSGNEVAVIVGAGPGFGYGVATRLASAGFRVALASRNAESHDEFVGRLNERYPWVRAYGCDATQEASVADMFAHACEDLGPPTLVVYAVQEGGRATFLDADVAAIEHAWRSNCLGAFVVARAAGRQMVARGRGTIVLVGSTSGLIGRAGYVSFALGRFGLRALSQVAARELGPQGVHVAHLVIDAEIAETELSDRNATMRAQDIAEVLYQVHLQPRSAWTQELDARPHNERFWEHC